MYRLLKSPFGILVVVGFITAVSVTICATSPQIVSEVVTPVLQIFNPDDPVILTVLNKDEGLVCNRDK